MNHAFPLGATKSADSVTSHPDAVELSIVMPCLNEARTVGVCVRKAQSFLEQHGIAGEVIVADNGSVDGSQQIAEDRGARVVPVTEKGYGNALYSGIMAARGRYIIMGDSDDSYDFSDLMPFVAKLREGYELVMGNRFRGVIKPGAMPPLHRYLGNPVLSLIGHLFFKTPARDFHCGLRGFTKEAAGRMSLRTTGMEFASEIVVKACLHGMRVTEVPITLSPDGRDSPPHLRSWRDGWRHLRFLLLYSPKWLFFYPGLILILTGLTIMALLMPGSLTIWGINFDVNSLVFAAAMVLIGAQSVSFYLLAKHFSVHSKLAPKPLWFDRVYNMASIETFLVIGVVVLLVGFAGAILAFYSWNKTSFGELNPAQSLRIVIPSALGLSLGSLIIFNSFFLGLLSTRCR
jgi:glycosyltransferase involved in cell wall biosynthesis